MGTCDRLLLTLTVLALLASGLGVAWHNRRDVAWRQQHECFLKADLEAGARWARVHWPRLGGIMANLTVFNQKGTVVRDTPVVLQTAELGFCRAFKIVFEDAYQHPKTLEFMLALDEAEQLYRAIGEALRVFVTL